VMLKSIVMHDIPKARLTPPPWAIGRPALCRQLEGQSR
jgi:hypothetical protein